MTAEPTISVIIPTYNRREALAITLDSLASQTMQADQFEVLVVDDGGSDGTSALCTQMFPFRLRYFWHQNQGSAAARNRGAAESTGRVLLFIDDDITLEPEYLCAIQRIHQQRERIVSMGQFQPYRTEHETPFAAFHALSVDRAARNQRDATDVKFTECTSNNVGILRQDFVEIGMWQDLLGDGRTIWGDVEFGYRAWKRGYSFVRLNNAKLYHRDYAVADHRTMCERLYSVSQSAHQLFERCPGCKAHLPMFFDKGPINLRVDSPPLIIRKVGRTVVSSPAAMWVMMNTIRYLEQHAPTSGILERLYQLTCSGFIYRGYRAGARIVPDR